MEGWLGWLVGLVVVALLCGAALWFQRAHGWLLRAIGAATSMLLIGAVVLLGTAQGRDLGSALLDATAGQHALFAAALLYWALATWHNSRVPVDRAHARRPAGGEGERWRIWLPRALGLGVFALALAHLALAWLAGGGLGRVLALACLVVAVGLIYWLFVVYRRRFGRAVLAAVGARAPGAAAGLERAYAPAPATAAGDRPSLGLALSTRVAFAFFLAVAVLLAVAAWTDPWALGAAAGSMALGFFAFGAYLTVMVGLWLTADRLGLRLAAVLVPLLLLAVVTTVSRDYHRVRLVLSADPLPPRPTVGEAAIAWYEQARLGAADGAELPMVFVATAGGGLRAAYWTAVVLAALERDLPAFRAHLFALSGVSGGSVGAAFFSAFPPHAATEDAPHGPALAALERDFLAPTLASLAFVDLPSLILPQFSQTSRGIALERAFETASDGRLAVPFLEFPAGATTGGWRPLLLFNATHQKSGRRVVASHVVIDGDTFLDAFDLHSLVGSDLPTSTAVHNSARFTYVSPAGSLRTARGEERGQIIDGGYFENFGAVTLLQLAREALDAIAEHRRERGAELPPVRPVFVQISSDPDLSPRDRAKLGDLVRCGAEGTGPLPFEAADVEGLLARSQLLAPLRGVLATRSAQGILASKELARLACRQRLPSTGADFAHLAMCDIAGPPLGWVMSEGARTAIRGFLDACGNPAERAALGASFGGVSATTN